MSVESVGKEILKEAGFERLREAIIEELVRKISRGGCYGADIRKIIEETFKEEEFVNFARKLARIIEEKTKIDREKSNKAACQLVEEEIADDIKNIFHGQLEERRNGKSKEEKQIENIGKESKLWDEATKRFVGKKQNVIELIAEIFREHCLIRYTIIAGFSLLILSAILFNSIYKAIVVGLTLTIFSSNSLKIKIANVLGGLGGNINIFYLYINSPAICFNGRKKRN
ncbi:MAG: hypothetical protein DRN11_03275 [Thermoplasmata archaeon]|nr:MAG: hypothetical protein DRN11_03275 [Thermoplasmata archaeon]